MKASLFRFGLILLQLFTSGSIHAQWIQTNGPYGGSVYSFGILDTHVYAGTSIGFYRSTINASSWRRSGLEGKFVYAIQTLSSGSGGADLFAGTYGNGVYKSIDSGNTWATANAGLIDLNVKCLATAVNSSGYNILLAGTFGSGVFRSVDNGATWNTTGWISGNIYDLAFADSVVFAATTSGVFRSIDYGFSWIPTATLPGTWIACLASAPDGLGGKVIYAGANGNGMYRSINYGASWSPMNTGLASTYVTDITVNDTDVYAMTVHGIRHTSGTSTSWTSVSFMAPLTLGIHDNGSGSLTFFAGYNDGSGVYRSPNAGSSWQSFSSGIPGRTVAALATFSNPNAGPLFAGTTGDGGGIFRTDDLGNTWEATNLIGIDTWRVGTFPHDSGGMVLLASGNSAGTHRSIDSGATWDLVLGDAIRSFASMPLSTGGRHVFAYISTGGVQLSSDFGLNWNPVNTGLTGLIISLAISDTILFAGSTTTGVFKTDNYGASWTPSGTGITNMNIRCLAALDSNIFAGTNGGDVFYSPNRGTSWTPVNTGLAATVINSLVFSGTDLFAGTNNGVFLSSNFGTTWTNISTGFFINYIYQLVISDTNIFAATTAGVWRHSLNQLVTGVDAPPEFKIAGLLSTFPNPFNTQATVEFIVHQPGLITLEIFNSSGALIRVLANEELSPGIYRRTWNPAGLPDGLYFCRLQTLKHQESSKLLLIR